MKIRSFRKSYEGRTALEMPELELADGKLYAVVGANGSGKSTLAKVLAGVEKADDGLPVLDCGEVGYLPQKSFAFRMTVEKNLLINGSDRARAGELMEALRIAPLAGKRANRLSGGETARMSLARLAMKEYALLILDEPTASMDMESTMLAEALIRRCLDGNGGTVLLITHSLQQARRMADEALFFHEGALTERGPAADVLYSPRDPLTGRFLDFYG